MLRGFGLLVLTALGLCGLCLAWQQTMTLAFEQELLAMEVANRERMPEVLGRRAVVVAAPGIAANTAIRAELRARWWLAWADRAATAGERRQLQLNARDELRLAVKLRPDAAFAWSALAAVKAQSGSIDQEFSDAFDRALLKAPNELRVQRQLLGIIMRYPDRLGSLQRDRAKQLLHKLDRRDPYLLIRQASRYHALPWLCAEQELSGILRSYCTQSGYPSP